MRVLLTGAATMLGAEIVRALLRHPKLTSLGLLLPAGEATRIRALQRLEAYLGPLPRSASTVVAELHLPRFGLPLAAFEALAHAYDLVLHCAQRETQDQHLELARQANLLPVEHWMQLLERNRSLHLHHLSTAFAGGTRRGLFTEFDLDCGQAFHNAFERSKYEAEVRLRESPSSDRVTIYRPSHLLGRSDTGEAFELAGAYPLLAALATASVLPGDAKARLDFVPADFVAEAMATLALSGARGTFHLAAGWHASLSVKEAAAIAAKAHHRARSARLVPLWPAHKAAGALLLQGPVFDTYRAARALSTRPPHAAQWLEVVARRAEGRHWELAAEEDARVVAAALPTTAAEAALTRADPLFHEQKFHQIGEVNVAYRDIGSGEPVVFLHGFAGARAWDGVVERIAGRRRALVIGTLGLSDTTGPSHADFSLQAQAARVRGLLSALEIPCAHIVGNEIGGVIAEFFAVRYPHCTKSLTLSDCGIGGPRPRLSKLAVLARSDYGFGKLVYDKRLLTPERIAQYVDTVAGDAGRRRRYKQFLKAVAQTDLALLQQLLAQLEVPAMIVWGAEDAYWSPSWARTLYDTIPGARRLELIPFAGVSCHEEKPQAFARVLCEFFEQVAPHVTPVPSPAPAHHSRGTSALTSRVYTT